MKRFTYLLVCLLFLQPIHTDQPAPCFPEAHVDVPKTSSRVPRNIRFRIGFFPAYCTLKGPEFQFKLVNTHGTEAILEKDVWQHFMEIKANPPLAPGNWTLKVRQPVSQNSLGPWQALSAFQVIAETDNTAPKFGGISSAAALAVRGWIPRSPCELQEAWVIKTTITFKAAVDSQCPNQQLLYVVDRRRHDSTEWIDGRTFRPAEHGGNSVFSWETHRNEWGQTWIYRLRVRDWAGNETIGVKTVLVENPVKPQE